MLNYGENLAKTLKPPVTLELVGDVGTGKTTLVRGLAKGLGIKDPVTSPSFTISKRYHIPQASPQTLIHYDFYRLEDPGLMNEDLSESISDPSAITVVEWADTVQGILPKNRLRITLKYRDDGTRELSEERP